MRASSLLLAAAYALVALAVAPAGVADASALDSGIAALVSAFPGRAAVWVSDPGLAQPLYARDPDRAVVAASLYKLAVLLEAERQVELGRVRYSDRLVIVPEDITDDGSFFPSGTELSVDEALEEMITRSDNGTAVHLWRMLGPAAINATLERSGLRGFRVQADRFEENVASARAVGTFLTLLAKRQLLSPAASDRMLRRLERQHVRDRIPAQLPDGVVVAHKTGNLPGIVHDAGIIWARSGPRVIVAMTYDSDERIATEFIARLASTVYAHASEAPAAVRYRVSQDRRHAPLGSVMVIDVAVENIGRETWTATGPGAMRLQWELRGAGEILQRSARPLALGEVRPGGSASVAVALGALTRAGDATLAVGLVDAAGRALSQFGVASVSVPVRVHLPPVASTEVRIPSLLHRGEASLIEVSYRGLEPVRPDDHFLTLGWRLLHPATGRAVAQGQQPLGWMRGHQTAGTFYAPLVAPNVRGTYVLEHEIRERGFPAGLPQRSTVEVMSPRTYPGTVGPSSAVLRLMQQRGQLPTPSPTAAPTPRRSPLPTLPPTPTPRPGEPRPPAPARSGILP